MKAWQIFYNLCVYGGPWSKDVLSLNGLFALKCSYCISIWKLKGLAGMKGCSITPVNVVCVLRECKNWCLEAPESTIPLGLYTGDNLNNSCKSSNNICLYRVKMDMLKSIQSWVMRGKPFFPVVKRPYDT